MVIDAFVQSSVKGTDCLLEGARESRIASSHLGLSKARIGAQTEVRQTMSTVIERSGASGRGSAPTAKSRKFASGRRCPCRSSAEAPAAKADFTTQTIASRPNATACSFKSNPPDCNLRSRSGARRRDPRYHPIACAGITTAICPRGSAPPWSKRRAGSKRMPSTWPSHHGGRAST